MRLGHAEVRRVPPGGHRDPALRLEQAVDVVGHGELRPPPPDLRGIEPLEGNPGGGHAVAVAAERDSALARAEVESAGLEHQLLARILLHLRPRPVGVLGQLDVLRRVIGEPDDPRVVLRLAPHVPELELLEPQDLGAGAAGEPVGRGAAPAAQAKDDVLVVTLHRGASSLFRFTCPSSSRGGVRCRISPRRHRETRREHGKRSCCYLLLSPCSLGFLRVSVVNPPGLLSGLRRAEMLADVAPDVQARALPGSTLIEALPRPRARRRRPTRRGRR
jgi:CBS domain-containing protein